MKKQTKKNTGYQNQPRFTYATGKNLYLNLKKYKQKCAYCKVFTINQAIHT